MAAGLKKVVGHEEQIARLARLVQTERLPNTFIFAGPSGIGKAVVARHLAALLFCENAKAPCEKCHQCRLLESETHPDLHYLDCEDRESGRIDSIRELLYQISLRPYSARHRVVIFDNAEDLNIQSSNLLLKSLEEPRPDTFFVLVAASPARLLPTLQSRAQTWFFGSLSSKELLKIISTEAATEKSKFADLEADLQRVADLSDGSLHHALHLAESLDYVDTWSARLDQLSAGDPTSIYPFSEEITKDKSTLTAKLQTLCLIARDKLRCASTIEAKQRWARFLDDLVCAEAMIGSRNLNALYIFSLTLYRLVDRNQQLTELGLEESVLSERLAPLQ